MALRKPDFRIEHVSDNTAALIGKRPRALLGQGLNDVLPQTRPMLDARWSAECANGHAAYMGEVAVARRRQPFAMHLHEAGGMAIVEFEPVSPAVHAAPQSYGMLQAILDGMHTTGNPEAVCDLVVARLKNLTGFGSVLACTLPGVERPRVVAEHTDSGYERYAAKHYPAADLPACVLDHYARTRMQVIHDTSASGASLLSYSGSDVEGIPDLQGATLGCMAPEVANWMQDVGGRSALILTLVVGGRSWGLIVCVNAQLHEVPMPTRMACDLVARSASLQIESLERQGRPAEDLAEDAHEQLDRARRARARSELEAFSYSASHEIQAPLRQILGYTELLEQSTTAKLSAQDSHCLASIGRAARRAHTLVEDLLGFSRLGNESLHYSDVSLQGLIELNRFELVPEMAERNVQWQVDPLPKVRADASLMNVVFRNLLSNALKYTRQRDPAVIHVGAVQHPHEVVIFVRDNGVGFDVRYIDRLFEVFQRLHRAENFEGTGIGLATVRRIIEHHHGRVWADSVLGKGATFYFSLPLPAL